MSFLYDSVFSSVGLFEIAEKISAVSNFLAFFLIKQSGDIFGLS